jgi:hypothetical protein
LADIELWKGSMRPDVGGWKEKTTENSAMRQRSKICRQARRISLAPRRR